MSQPKGLRATSPVHVHVDDDIPVHVHVKQPKKKAGKNVSYREYVHGAAVHGICTVKFR